MPSLYAPSLDPGFAPALSVRALANPAFFNASAVPLPSAEDWTVCVASSDDSTDQCCSEASGVLCPVWGCRLSLEDSKQQSTFTKCTDSASHASNGGRTRACKSYKATFDEAVKQLQVGEGWWSAPLAGGQVVCTAFGGRNETAADCCTQAKGQRQEKSDKTPETCLIEEKSRDEYEACLRQKHESYAVCTDSVTGAKGSSSGSVNAAKSAAPRTNFKATLAIAALAVAALAAL